MPENESLDALLRKGDPAGELQPTQSEERYARLLQLLIESAPVVAVPVRGGRRLLWGMAPALGLMALAVVILWRPAASPEVGRVPGPVATPSAIVLNSTPAPIPLPTAKPAPLITRKRLAQKTEKNEKPQRRYSQRRHRKRIRTALVQRSRRPHTPRVPEKVQPAETANVERIVIESTQPAAPVAIAIVGEGENLSVIQTFQEEKS